MQHLDISNTVCKEYSGGRCVEFELRLESTNKLMDTMFIFEVFQSGLIFAALTAGLVSIGHVIYCRAVICSNASLLLVILLTGFCHLILCVYLLQISEQSANYEMPRGGNQLCNDYYLPATLANTIILTAIAYSIIRVNINNAIVSTVVWTVSFGSIFGGLLSITRLIEYSPPKMEQETFVTLGRSNETHFDVFWSVCKKEVSEEKLRLLAEYGLIYVPIIIIVLFGWSASYKRNKDMCLLKIKIIDSNCCKNESDVCVCSRIGPVYVAILVYSAIIILIARPAMIVHAQITTGTFRDILPSLLHTVMFCFVCSEYLTRTLRLKTKITNTHCNASGKNSCDKTALIIDV